MDNYIVFYFSGDKLLAEIHKDGRCRLIKSERNLRKLLGIISSYDIDVKNNTPFTKNFRLITKEYENYINKQKRKVQIYNIITGNMKVKRTSKTGKIIATTALITALSIAGNTATKHEVPTFNNKNTEIELNMDEVNEVVTNELNEILESSSFHYSYEDRSQSNRFENAKEYEDIFEKYATRYGLDKNLLMAMAAQESSGNHENHLDNGPAEGIMQIEKSVYTGHSLHAYNFETGEVEDLKVTSDNLQDLDTNIRIGAMIFQNYLEQSNYNIPIAVQKYNYGPGNMNTVLGDKSKYFEEHPTNSDWLENRDLVSAGDSEYIEHVFSFLPTNLINVKTRDNKNISIMITNNYEKEKNL